MSKYTTGEIAKLCGVTVRTVQYYDSRSILSPSELSEGGRRLYSEDDLRRMKVICFLRETGLPIKSISQIFAEKDSREVIALLLQQQEILLKGEISERQEQLQKLNLLSKEIKNMQQFSLESIGDIAHQMNSRKKLRKIRLTMLGVGIPLEILEIATLILWIRKGIWLPYVLGMLLIIAGSVWISVYYFRNVAYICPQCHTVFKPKFKEAFWASHTPTTRKLTCPHCGRKGFCVETASSEPPAE